MKKIFLITFYIFHFSSSFSQNHDLKRSSHWYFGHFAGLDFNTGIPVPDTNGVISTLEGVSAISDTNGVLQCYFGFGWTTNNQWCVYNREHTPMPNGCNLGTATVSTPRDGSIFVPKPGDDSTYYLFTVDGWENQFQRGLRWHEIDMRQDSGKGDVVSADNVLFAPVTEQLAATRHANGCDYWVVSHERSNANFLAYKVTVNGIDTVPVVSTVGTDYNIPQQLHWASGGAEIRFSPNGNIVAVVVYWAWLITGIPEDLELFQFDNSTGIFSNCINFPTNNGITAIGFSPDNTKMYGEDTDSIAYMYQWDISLYDSIMIFNSKQLVFTHPNTIAEDYQQGNDGKLYITNEYLNGVSNPPYLSTIENPNAGSGIIVLPGSTSTGGRGVSQGLPHFVSNFTANMPPPFCATGNTEIKIQDESSVFPNPVDNYFSIKIDMQHLQIKIFNAIGVLVKDITKNSDRINVSHLDNGIYFIQIIMAQKKTRTFKLVVNHY